MSIKPVAWMVSWIFDDKVYRSAHLDRSVAERVCKREGTEEIEELYAVPDTHCIMPLKLTEKMIAAAIPELMREDDEDKYRALGQLICVWDALVEAVKEEQP